MPRLITDNPACPNYKARSSDRHEIHAGLIIFGLVLGGLMGGCGKGEPEYVEVQEIAESPQVQTGMEAHSDHEGHDHAEGEGHGSGFTFDMPAGWMEKVPSSMIIMAFQTAEAPELIADVSISAFPGDVGGQAANINRWRRQVGLGPLDPESALALITPVDISGMEGWQVELEGPEAGGMAPRMVVSAVSHAGKTWFFKMTGPAPAVEGALDNYQAFVGSVKF